MSDCLTLYTTFTDKAEAERIIDALLEKRLIACANVMGEATSHYRWEGKREQTVEVPVLIKTTAEHQQAAIALITQMHSYDCPCVVVWPIVEANSDYLQWIKHETRLPNS